VKKILRFPKCIILPVFYEVNPILKFDDISTRSALRRSVLQGTQTASILKKMVTAQPALMRHSLLKRLKAGSAGDVFVGDRLDWMS
jgi:hypothetical protein